MSRFFARFAVRFAALMIASAGGAVAITFLIIAFYLLLTGMMAPWLAALATAGAALVFSVLVLLIARLAPRKPPPPPAMSARLGLAAEMGELIGRQAREFVEGNSYATLAGLLVAGLAIGISPRLRRLLMRLL